MLETAPREGSRREQAKDERRTRIVGATYDLLREVGTDELSVKMIADRADVSPATVYNLFKTKAAVLEKVNEIDLVSFETKISRMKSSGLDRIFEAAVMSAKLYRNDPGFYRAMNWTRDVSPDDDSSIKVHRISERFWTGLVTAAIEEGDLRPDTDARRVGIVLMQLIAGTYFHWVSNIIGVDLFEEESIYGFAAILSGFATKQALPKLQERMDNPMPSPKRKK